MGITRFNRPLGVTKLSELEIDADKDWGEKKIIKPSAVTRSIPPPGYCRVINFYLEPATEKMVVEYDDTPAS